MWTCCSRLNFNLWFFHFWNDFLFFFFFFFALCQVYISSGEVRSNTEVLFNLNFVDLASYRSVHLFLAMENLTSFLDFITTLTSCLEIICDQQLKDLSSKTYQAHKTGISKHLNPVDWKNKDKEKVGKLKPPWGTRKLRVGGFYKSTHYTSQFKKEKEWLP